MTRGQQLLTTEKKAFKHNKMSDMSHSAQVLVKFYSDQECARTVCLHVEMCLA